MKNYDLSQYMIRHGEILIFPITKEEVGILKNNRADFSVHLGIPYITSPHSKKTLEQIENKVDMENDYWFMDTLWMVVHTKTKEVYGTLRYEKDGESSKIIKNITMLFEYPDSYEGCVNLFAKFLEVNNYKNITVEEDKLMDKFASL